MESSERAAATMEKVLSKFFDLVVDNKLCAVTMEAVLATLEAVLATMRQGEPLSLGGPTLLSLTAGGADRPPALCAGADTAAPPRHRLCLEYAEGQAGSGSVGNVAFAGLTKGDAPGGTAFLVMDQGGDHDFVGLVSEHLLETQRVLADRHEQVMALLSQNHEGPASTSTTRSAAMQVAGTGDAPSSSALRHAAIGQRMAEPTKPSAADFEMQPPPPNTMPPAMSTDEPQLPNGVHAPADMPNGGKTLSPTKDQVAFGRRMPFQRDDSPSPRSVDSNKTPVSSNAADVRCVDRNWTCSDNNDEVDANCHYEPLSCWVETNAKKHSPSGKPAKGNSQQQLAEIAAAEAAAGADGAKAMEKHEETVGCKPPLVHPHSTKRGVWDLLSMILVIYDLFGIPLNLFDPPETGFAMGMAWITRLFWTADMPMSFVSGLINNDGSIEMRSSKIVKKYMMSWFALDILVVGVDWIEVILAATADEMGYAKLGKASRTFRILRLIRLLRLLRMGDVLKSMLERITSDTMMIVADILKILVIIIGTAHIIACVFWAIGNTGDERSWVADGGYDAAGLDNLPSSSWLEYRYTTSLHWSLLQFGGGTDEIIPQTPGERWFAIIVFLMAYMMAAVFISKLTSSMTQLAMLTNQQSKNLSVLRRYLAQIHVSRKLALRVQRNAQHALLEQTRSTPEKAVELLQLVSEPLRVELHFEMYSASMNVHPLFKTYSLECPQVMRKVCHHSTSVQLVSTGDVIFHAGEAPAQPKMYFILDGRLDYEAYTGDVLEVEKDDWISEAALWCQWTHRGVLQAGSNCKLAVLDSLSFQQIASQFDHTGLNLGEYATRYVRQLNRRDPADVLDFSRGIEESVLREMADDQHKKDKEKNRESANGNGRRSQIVRPSKFEGRRKLFGR